MRRTILTLCAMALWLPLLGGCLYHDHGGDSGRGDGDRWRDHDHYDRGSDHDEHRRD